MKEAILKGDIIKFAEILGKSWQSKKMTAKSIGNNQVDYFYDIAMANGA